jgi:hypothetical protein
MTPALGGFTGEVGELVFRKSGGNTGFPLRLEGDKAVVDLDVTLDAEPMVSDSKGQSANQPISHLAIHSHRVTRCGIQELRISVDSLPYGWVRTRGAWLRHQSP